MKTENYIVCPYCNTIYHTDNINSYHEGDILKCSGCKNQFQVVDIENVIYVTTEKIK
jgi:predicted Zn finger-like uncharacterized protein